MRPSATSISIAAIAALLFAALLAMPGCSSSSAGSKSGTAGSTATGGHGGAAASGTGGGGASTVSGTGGQATGGATSSGTAAASGGGSTGTGGSAAGGNGGTITKVGQTQCSDGKDNDGDGKIDLDDPECTGPLDNDESSFATGIPGDNMDPCRQDCFFDGNSGAGDDHCNWDLKCDPANTSGTCPYSMSYASSHTMECSISASQPQQCIDFCRRYVPNGCDCFGCCVVPGVATPIRLSATCTAANFGDPTKCMPCTQVTQCNNTCERCELCIGKTSVPSDCNGGVDGGTVADGGTPTDGGGVPTCDNGTPHCGPQFPGVSCPEGTGCVTGCCIPSPM